MADQQLQAEILGVLDNARTGKGYAPGFLTAYQVLQRLPEPRRQALQDKYGVPGKGAKTHYSAASRIATELDAMQADVDKGYFDPIGTMFEVGDGQYREAGFDFIAIYRRHP